MSNNHVLTKDVGNLRGFSTDSNFVRPSNVATDAINMMRYYDGTFSARRGYQAQAENIGGLGTGTYQNVASNEIETVTLNTDGNLYKKLEKQIYLNYNGRRFGNITAASQANPCQITSMGHGLITGTVIIIQNVVGMTQLNNNTYTITLVDANNFTLNGVNSTAFTPYISGGIWTIAFTQYRNLNFTIFTDPRFNDQETGNITGASQANPCQITSVNHGLSTGNTVRITHVLGMTQLNNNSYIITVTGVNTFTLNGVNSTGYNAYISGGSWITQNPYDYSITCQVTANMTALGSVTQNMVNIIDVYFGHNFAINNVVQFIDSFGNVQQRTITNTTDTTITINGAAVSVNANTSYNLFLDVLFGTGFDEVAPFLISQFVAAIQTPNIFGLKVDVNGDQTYPAAFIEIIEDVIIQSNSIFNINYFYWQVVNNTVNVTFPGSADPIYQNSPNFINADFETFNDVLYITNGLDFPQKYDNQTAYRAGAPQAVRPTPTETVVPAIRPFTMGQVYSWAITVSQTDNLGNYIEGAISPSSQITIANATAAADVQVSYVPAGSGWNTDIATATGGACTVYGPDINGFYYHLAAVTNNTMKILDKAFFSDFQAGTVNGNQNNVFNITIAAGHNIQIGQNVAFTDNTPVIRRRAVTAVTPTVITISGPVVSVTNGTTLATNNTNPIYGNIAISTATVYPTNIINVLVGHTIQIGDIVSFTDGTGRIQRRNVTNTAAGNITVDGNPIFSIANLSLITSETMRAGQFSIQTKKMNPIVLSAAGAISSGLGINIYRTMANGTQFFYLATAPNANTFITYLDNTSDAELGPAFANPINLPNPPPISKYILAFGNQLMYAGGQIGVSDNSNNVFFSESNSPEAVPAATNFFSLPNPDDVITGIASSGTTLIILKTRSIYAVSGNLNASQYEVTPIAPGRNIGCIANATIASVGSLIYFLDSNGVYAITENQIFPTDPFGNPIPISAAITQIFNEMNFLPQTQYIFTQAVACNYTKDKQYLLFLPCQDANPQSNIINNLASQGNAANTNSILLMYDYEGKNWFKWTNMNAAGGIFTVGDDLYFQERRFSSFNNENVANLYKQHRFYRLVDHADHAAPQLIQWKSSWEDLGLPEVRKKFVRCMLLINTIYDLQQQNLPPFNFKSYLDRIDNLPNTIATVTTVDNTSKSSWNSSGWGWNRWSGYQDTFARVNLKGGTVAKAMQVGFTLNTLNTDFRLAGFQLEAVPENRKTFVR